MKIFHLMSGRPFGGVERQIERLAEVLQHAGIEQRAMLAENPARAQRLAAAGIIPVEMPFPSRFAFIDRRRINSFIRRFGPDIVISWSPDMAGLVQKGDFIHIGRVPPDCDVALLTACEHLLTPSTARAGLALATGWPADKVHVLPHLPRIDSAAVKPVNRKVFYTPPTAKLIVTAIRLVKSSGLDALLDAVSRLSGYYLWIAGDGTDRAALEELAIERGVKPRVRFIGWHDELAPIIAAADVFVYPARQEDVADAVVEAWATGAAVVAADSLGPGLLIKHKENGLLVPVGDGVSMAEAIKWVCQDQALAHRLGEAGRAQFREHFAADKVAPRYVDLFNRLAAKPSPAVRA